MHDVRTGEDPLSRISRFAWGVLGYNLVVILWGAYVRATGSGAGCGSHWPTCNGEIVPRTPAAETLIEFTHRATSGLALLAVVALFIWTRRAYLPGHLVRRGAAASLVIIVIEALLGAGLVLFELVAEDASALRAIAMVAHLINTFLLVAALALTAWWTSGGATTRLRDKPVAVRLLIPALLGLLAVGATGAIAALGDTLFPTDSLAGGLRASFAPDSHPLIQLRKYHPLLAVLVGGYVVWVVRFLRRRPGGDRLKHLAAAVTALYLIQLLSGVVNMVLLAPVPMQLVHLLLADAVWISVVLLTVAAPADGGPSTTPLQEEAVADVFVSRR